MLLKVLKGAIQSLFARRVIQSNPTQDDHTAEAGARHIRVDDLAALLANAASTHRQRDLQGALNMYRIARQRMLDAPVQARAAVHLNMGAILRELVRVPEAIDQFKLALSLQPSLAEAHYNLGLAFYESGEIEAAEIWLKSAIEIAPDLQVAHSSLLCLYGFAKSGNPDIVLAAHRRWAEKFADPLTRMAPPHANERNVERRLTVGYVSADFKEHSVARFIAPIFANHDRARFRVICYDNWPRGDATSQRLRGLVDEWRKIDGLDDSSAAALVRADGVDILVDLSGHTTGNRLLLFAQKPAPVQVSWFGYMCTTGMTAIDWRITDAYMDPPGSSEWRYVERLIRIASVAAFEPHPDSPDVSVSPVLTNGFVRFGSFNNYAKIGDEVITLWGQVLSVLPNAKLLLVVLGGDDAQIQASVRDRFVRLTATPDIATRIDIMGRRSPKEFLHLFHLVDIALDPFPYGGGTTSLHCLWMGVAIVTLEGESELSRSTSGMLIACGLDDLVARSETQYLDTCIRLATNPKQLVELRAELRQRFAKSAFCDGKLVTRDLEDAFRHMWADYLQSSHI
ncbi:MAG: tetratricopeptide repeat protein [Burkholderiales bacterium]